MSKAATQHTTLVLGRALEVPATRVFAALASPVERARMAATADDVHIVHDASDFRVGGWDVYRFGPWGSPRFHVRTIYHDIVPDCRIVSSDVVSERGKVVAAALATLEIRPLGPRCQVRLTVQLARLDDRDGADGSEDHYAVLLDNLGRYLGRSAGLGHDGR